MKKDFSVLTGVHEFTGNEACAEGAIAARCQFFSTYPIPPANEIAERFLMRCKKVGATFIQMEDEIAVLAAVLGAVWTGKRGMAVTSGPGFSLMMEHVGLAAMLETPCVIVDVQRLGPSTGLPEIPAEADIMQARWGSHGDYEIIALSPNSAQEVFDLTIKAFNFAEQYRIPVMMMIDKDVAYRREKVVIPDASEIKIHPRKYYKGRKDKYLPYQWDEKDLIPPMVDIGEGYRFHVTGLTHDQRGYPVMNAECQELCVHRLVEKIRRAQDKIIEIEEIETKDAEVIVISYGNTSRIVASVIERARKEGIKAGSIRLITVWPFPEKRIKKIAEKVKAFVVLERNYGQIVFEVERASYGKAGVIFVSPDERGMNISEESIFRAIKEGVNYKKRRDE